MASNAELNGELFAIRVSLSCSNHQNTFYLIVSVINSENVLTTSPFPLRMARSKLIVDLVIIFLNEYRKKMIGQNKQNAANQSSTREL